MSAPEGMYNVSMKPKLLRSLLREYVPDERHPFTNPSELSYVVSTVKTHKLLSERASEDVGQDVVEAWKAAVDSWLNRLLALTSSNLPDKCWAGICLLGLTFQESSSERFLTSYDAWLNKLLLHIQTSLGFAIPVRSVQDNGILFYQIGRAVAENPSVSSHFVKAASCASLSDMFTRLSEFSNAKRDGTSQATKVIQLLLELFNEDTSDVVLEQAICLLCTLIDFFPLSVHRHYDNVEAAIVAKLISGKCSPSVLKNLGRGLSLLPKSRGDEDSWSLMMNKILLYVNGQLNDVLQGLEEEAKSTKATRDLLPAGKEPPPPLGGLAASEHSISARRPERLLASRISSLLQCCSDMLSTCYPVMVPVPVCGLIALAGRVLLVDGSSSMSSYSFMTTLKQEFVCSEIPVLQFQTLEILTAIVKGLGSQVLPHVADLLELLKEYLRRCKFPELKIKAYSILKVLLMSMGVGLAMHVSRDIVSNVYIDLDFFTDEKDSKKVQPELSIESHNKKRKRTKTSLQENSPHGGLEIGISDNLTPISLKISALETIEALLTVSGSIGSESWRGDVDKLLITVATYACRGGWSNSKDDKKTLLSDDTTPTLGDFQLAALRALLASLLSPGRVRPPHLDLGLELFHRGLQATGTRLAEYCRHALLALEVLIHPRGLPLLDSYSSADDYKSLVQLHKTHQADLPESEDDDLIENWFGKDDVMEIEPTKSVHDDDDDTHMVELPHLRNASDQENTTADGGGLAIESAAVENAVSEAKRDAVSPKNGSESTGNELSALMERISSTLANPIRSRGGLMMFESDNESVESFPDIVDGDPDSD